MALASESRSSLNPNAPVFIPAAVRQVEEVSPKWLSQHEGGNSFYMSYDEGFSGYDVVDRFPESFHIGVDEELLKMEEQLEEFLLSSEYEETDAEARDNNNPKL